MSLFELRDIHRSFGGVHALRGASFKIEQPGRVHALLGSNGCGKSTLLRIATGQLRADAGEIHLDGKPVSFAQPRDALRCGIATVTQETTLAPDLTVAENILMGKLPRYHRFGPINWDGTYRLARDLLDSLGLDLPADVLVRYLRPDQQQMVEIARAFSMRARILVLDEATSALTDDQVESVFRIVRNAGQHGAMATIFVSHRMDEIYALADEVTVLRDGKTVSTRRVAEVDRETLVADMVGDSVASISTKSQNRATAPNQGRRLQLDSVYTGRGVKNATLTAARGEIVGLTGLTRSGANELLEAIFGSQAIVAGRVQLDGQDIPQGNINAAIKMGIGFVPADRKLQGVLLHMSVGHNLLMPSTSDRFRLRAPARAQELGVVDHIARSVDLRMKSADSLASTLSGGNQQKVVIGKWLIKPLKLLLLAEPTRGVDVNAKAQIHELLRKIASEGTTVLFASTELDEVLALASRVVVMFQGRIVADLPVQQVTEHAVTSMMSGVAA